MKFPRAAVAAVRLVRQAAAPQFDLAALTQAVGAMAIGLQLLAGQRALGALVSALRSGHPDLAAILLPLLALTALTVLVGVATAAAAGQGRLLAELTIRHLQRLVLMTAASVDLEEFEKPDFFDALRRVTTQGAGRAISIALGLVALGTGVASTLVILVYLYTVHPLLVPVVAIGYAPVWIAGARNSEEMYRFAFGNTPNDRHRQRLESILEGRSEAKEVRSFGLRDFLMLRWEALYSVRIAEATQRVSRVLRRSVVASAVSSLLGGLVLGLLVGLVLAHWLSIEKAAIAAIAIQQLGGSLNALARGAGDLLESARHLDDFVSFEARYRRVAGPVGAPPDFGHLEVSNLSYRYPGMEQPALSDVSMEIHPGEVVALVGENGSGKTTLARLLAGLVAPTSGSIRWAGTDVSCLGVESVRDRVAVLFQDFVRYPLSVADNIGAGRPERLQSRDDLVGAATAAGADAFISSLPQGYDTLLARDFEGGADLSVGQWQRVALARAYFRDAPFLILDEPTAALDARSEYELFQSIRDLTARRSVLLISHRFSSVRSADRIYVLHAGRVVEHGKHDELMALNGRYAEMYNLQAAAFMDPLEAEAPLK